MNKKFVSFVLGIPLAVAFLVACGKPEPKTVTIAIVNLTSSLEIVVDGFKDGMVELGYVGRQAQPCADFNKANFEPVNAYIVD